MNFNVFIFGKPQTETPLMKIKELYWDRWGFSLCIQSNGEEQDGNMLHIHIGKMNAYIQIHQLIKAKETKVYPKWDAKTVARLGRDWYIDYTKKQFGFTFCDDAIHTYYGIQPGSWIKDDPDNSDHVKLFSYPWNYEHVRYEVFFADGTYACTGTHFHFWKYAYDKESPEASTKQALFALEKPLVLERDAAYARDYKHFMGDYDNWGNVVSTKKLFKFFEFSDPYDGEVTQVRANIDEREWVRGIYPWLRAVLGLIPACHKIHRCMEMEFYSPVGGGKSDWKGGTTGMGYQMHKDETLDEAWARFIVDDEQIKRLKRVR